MKKISILVTILFLTVFMFGGVSQALTLGNNITINDQMPVDLSGDANEDNECETGMIQSQAWDLEGFFLYNQTLAIVGGYDFKDGVSGYQSGDIFIDIDDDTEFGGDDQGDTTDRGYTPISNTFGYDFVLDIDFLHSTYNILRIDSSTILKSVYYNDLNTGSNPWRYESGATETIASNQALTFYDNNTEINTAAAGAGLLGWNNDNAHYGATFDISSILNTLTTKTELTFHNTMGCGNDNLMGRTTAPVPEPATIFLMFAGILGLAGVRRQQK